MSKDFFSPFTRKYQLSKTLRFELKPIGQTLENMEKAQILVHDKEKEVAYQIVKPLLDKLHEKFINESLKKAKNISWKEYYSVFAELRKLKLGHSSGNIENAKQKQGKEKELKKIGIEKRKEIVALFLSTGKDWAKKIPQKKDKKEDNDTENLSGIEEKAKGGSINKMVIFEKEVFQILLEEFPERTKEEREAIDSMKGFTTYFTGFHENRKNYYASDDKDTAVANRIVEENFPKFANNIIAYQSRK